MQPSLRKYIYTFPVTFVWEREDIHTRMGVTQEVHKYFLSVVHTGGGAYTHTCIGVTQEVHIVTQAVHMYFLSDVILGVFG